MNPLLAQFIEEAGEHLAVVDAGLLELERDPGNAEVVNDIFRAAHTLKGSSGLFDMEALTHLTHAAEDVLDVVRSGGLAVGSDLVDAVMAAFDLVGSWVATLAATESLPADAAGAAAPVAAALRALIGADDPGGDDGPVGPGRVATPVPVPDWAAALAPEGAATVVRYAPAADCFFRGEDPLHLVRSVPGLVHLGVAGPQPWPAVADLDEFTCATVFELVSTAGADVVADVFRYVPDEVEVVAVPAPVAVVWRGVAVAPAAARSVRAVIAGQAALLRAVAADAPTAPADGTPGGTPSATDGRVDAAVAALTAALGGVGLPTGEIDRARRGGVGPAGLAALAEGLVTEVDRALAGADGSPVSAGPRPSAAGGEAVRAEGGPRALKVDQAKVDRIMDLVGELIVAKNALPFLAASAEDDHGVPALARAVKEQYGVLSRLTEELQGSVMDIRMLPMSVAFGRFPRLVRDVSRKLGKDVTLVTEGDDTRADKDVIDRIADPLVHLVRNALDHGIEGPGDRRAAGKPAAATLTLAARQDGDAIVIEVRDDGRGVDPDRVRAKAVERGLLDVEAAAALRDGEAVDLIFTAGFSTAAEVSDLSGRGVGMDAVRDVVERLGGRVGVASVVGAGTTVSVRVPLSVAMSRVMVVGVGGQRFGVPVDLVNETVRVGPEAIQRIKGTEAIVLRDRLVPLVSLQTTLGTAEPDPAAGRAVLVVTVDGEPLGLGVDRFHGDLEVIVKPLRGVGATRGFAGTALLGDGDILLVLRPKELLHAA